MKIYLDDTRDTPDGFHRTFTVEETIALLKENDVEVLSLDNDLGEGSLEGYKVVDWLEAQMYFNPNFSLPRQILVHSANAVRHEYMLKVIGRMLERYT